MFKKIMKYILTMLFLGLVVIQFISRPEQLAEPIDAENDMMALLGVNGELRDLIQSTCYDCHSNQPDYPWYSSIAPISWWTNEHMEHGREELNFSNWGTYSKRRKDHKLDEIGEEVSAGKMPLPSYTWVHGKLSEAQKKMIQDWVDSERAKLAAEDN